ncbi:MAG: 16S rRNA (guanine(966)-N(2))-methyltransferase RsmD [Bacteroidetes Order II. Incertae sedis bacterium]|nr:16S rRNA (guanine(966)-N(2))-methyltransferase RsmD [Bacteroidetes Order II. bacterium]
MRIIAGKFKGRSLKSPKGEITRPTTDRVRTSVFNLLYSRMEMRGARVLDMFAGTGALGIESMSRGAESTTFIELNRTVLELTKQNASIFGIEKQCWFQLGDAVGFIQKYRGPQFDVVFADPPYELEAIPQLPEWVFPQLKPEGLFVLEHDARHSFDEHPALDTSRAYGRTIVSVFRPALLNELDDD